MHRRESRSAKLIFCLTSGQESLQPGSMSSFLCVWPLTTDKQQYPQSVETVIVQLEVLFALGPTMDIVHWTTQVNDTQFMQLNTACTNHDWVIAHIFFAVLVPTSFALTEGKVHVLLGHWECWISTPVCLGKNLNFPRKLILLCTSVQFLIWDTFLNM